MRSSTTPSVPTEPKSAVVTSSEDELTSALASPPAKAGNEPPEFVHWFGNTGEAAIVVQTEMSRDDILRMFGWDPEKYRILEPMEETHWTMGTFTNHRYKFRTQRINADGEFEDEFPKWPVVQQGQPIVISPSKVVTPKRTPKASSWKTAVVGGDTQFGYRYVSDDEVEEFHDEHAISVFHQIIGVEKPEQVVIVGDIGDFPQQSTKFIAEAGFARTTQPTIDRMTQFAGQLRADAGPDSQIVWIEGNHDKRLQNFVEINAQSALGLRKGLWPSSYPVMSIPYLCRLDEFDIEYKDAYPTSHHWINENLRAEHGDRSNNNGSTAERYARETPHISRIFGHSHRLEVMPRTTYDRSGRISSKFINTGCLCKVDGTVPSFHGARGADGRSATYYENWQHGMAVIRYRDSGEFFVNLVAIEDGVTVYEGQEIRSKLL